MHTDRSTIKDIQVVAGNYNWLQQSVCLHNYLTSLSCTTSFAEIKSNEL